ncbi:MAG: polysaccharide pyruvyl transferase family protein [Rikenellaceae bacterium]
MKKTATLTFHASHNYGSMLQAYALQKTLEGLGCENEIINLRTHRQKMMYMSVKSKVGFSLRYNVKKMLLRLLNLFSGGAVETKYSRFETFLCKDLKLSEREYSSLQELESSQLDYDYFIAGSDQIWKTKCSDFSWAYYLPFANCNAISYAPSLGPGRSEIINYEDQKKIKQYLLNFKNISVREESSADIIEQISGERPQVLLDPTMLLTLEQWQAKIPEKAIVEGDYILLYSPFFNKDLFEMAREFSSMLNMKVVVSNLPGIERMHKLLRYQAFDYKVSAGPWEFLNLVRDSSLVISASFHAVVFSILLKRPFYALNGERDARVSNVLKFMNLSDRALELSQVKEKKEEALNVNFENNHKYLESEIQRSLEFLKKSLEL